MYATIENLFLLSELKEWHLMPYILVVQNFEEITDQLVTKVLCDMAVL